MYGASHKPLYDATYNFWHRVSQCKYSHLRSVSTNRIFSFLCNLNYCFTATIVKFFFHFKNYLILHEFFQTCTSFLKFIVIHFTLLYKTCIFFLKDILFMRLYKTCPPKLYTTCLSVTHKTCIFIIIIIKLYKTYIAVLKIVIFHATCTSVLKVFIISQTL